MTFDLKKIVESKRAMRAKLRALPIDEKMRLLDQLRERTLAIREAGLRKGAFADDTVPKRQRSGLKD